METWPRSNCGLRQKGKGWKMRSVQHTSFEIQYDQSKGIKILIRKCSELNEKETEQKEG